MLKRLLVVGALSMLMAGTTKAQSNLFATGNDIQRTCSSKQTSEEIACLSYIRGVIHGHIITKAGYDDFNRNNNPSADLPPEAFCLPEGFDYGQIRDVLLRHLEENPAQRHLPGAKLLMEAIFDAFPCPKDP